MIKQYDMINFNISYDLTIQNPLIDKIRPVFYDPISVPHHTTFTVLTLIKYATGDILSEPYNKPKYLLW